MTGDEPHVGGPADCGESDGEPFDLHAVLSDDALLDALGPDGLDDTEVREQFADSQPDALIELLLTVRESAGAADAREPDGGRPASSGCGGPESRPPRPVGGGATGPRRSRRISLTLGAAALVAALLAAGIGARAAEPDDALWPVTSILYPQRAESVDAADQATRRLDAAAAAMAAGDDLAARIELQAAESQLTRVRAEDGRPALQARHGDLDRALNAAAGDDADAGTRTTQPSPGPARRGPAVHRVPPASQRDTLTTISITTARITTRPPEGARRRTGERPAGRPDAPRTTPGHPERGHARAPGAAHRADTARPAGQGSPAGQAHPSEQSRRSEGRRPLDEGRPAEQPRRAEPARPADQAGTPHQSGSPGNARCAEPAPSADRARIPDQPGSSGEGRRSADAGTQGHDRASGRSGPGRHARPPSRPRAAARVPDAQAASAA
jgi:hypothetical protein